MGAVQSPGPASLLEDRVHRFAWAWALTRRDGTVLRFTDHDHTLQVDATTFYTPVGGFSASAKQRQSNLKSSNMEFLGIFDNTAITMADVRAGKYQYARVDEMLLDWLYPWVPPFQRNTYWIGNIAFTGEVWQADIQGVSLWLNRQIGDVYGRNCRYEFGDAECKKVRPFVNSTVLTVPTPNVKFTSAVGGSDGLYDMGDLVFTSGPNVGLVFETRKFLVASGSFSLQLPTPFAITPGDTFTAFQGCDKKLVTCNTKFTNVPNNGGFPTIPGTNTMIRSATVSKVNDVTPAEPYSGRDFFHGTR